MSSPFTSPMPPGRGSASGHGSKKNPIPLDTEDDDAVTDSSLGSSPYFTQPTQIMDRNPLGPKRTGTQPTQKIIGGRTLTSAASKSGAFKNGTRPSQATNLFRGGNSSDSSSQIAKSSPQSKIEVPRSSPFKSSPSKSSPPQARRNILGFQPAGTSFVPPSKLVTKNATVGKNSNQKPTFPDSSDELTRSPKYRVRADPDSSGSDEPDRGDIERTSFQRHAPSVSPKKIDSRPAATVATAVVAARRRAEAETAFQTQYDSRTQLKARMVRKKVGADFTLKQCAEAILAKRDVDAASKLLLGDRSSLAATSDSPKRSSPSHSQDTPPAPKRRRLVQGRNPKSAPAPVIDLVDSDDSDGKESVSNDKNDRDDYEADTESDADSDESENEAKKSAEKPVVGTKRTTKIIDYLQSCTVDSLAADAKITKDDAKYMISKRPFQSINQVKGIYHFKVARKKRERVNLGEEIFDELNQHLKRLNAIDRVVQLCDAQGKIVQKEVSSWRMDQIGDIKESGLGTAASAVLPFPKAPKLIQGTLYPYQLYGMNWMWQLCTRGFGGILADDMGLGKTCQVISLISLLSELKQAGVLAGMAGPNLVVVPASVLDNWLNEFAKFAPGLSIVKYSGSPTERDELAAELRESGEEYDVIVTSYTQIKRTRDATALSKIGIGAAIFDEGHKLKNPETNLYRDLILIKAKWKLLITGTPIQNNIMEMITLLNFISPNLFQRDRECFEELFAQKASLKEVSEGATLLSDRIQRARSILEPFILQRKKEQVLTSLPPKTRKVIYVDMPGRQKTNYEEKVANFRRSKIEKTKTKTFGRKSDENNPWAQLRKASTHPQLFRRFYDDQKIEEMAEKLLRYVPYEKLRQTEQSKMAEELRQYSDFELNLWCRDEKCLKQYSCPEEFLFESGKFRKLLELLKEYRQNGDRALVFSKFRRVLDILEECLSKEGISYRVLDGDTNVKDRQVLVDEYQADESISVFLLTTDAGGQGINLTAANKIVILDQSNNPQQDVQAENRAHRLGQKREVEVVRLITRGTIDELIYKACQKKLELAGHITGFSEDIGGEAEVIAKVTEQLLNGSVGSPPSDAAGYITPPKSDQCADSL